MYTPRSGHYYEYNELNGMKSKIICVLQYGINNFKHVFSVEENNIRRLVYIDSKINYFIDSKKYIKYDICDNITINRNSLLVKTINGYDGDNNLFGHKRLYVCGDNSRFQLGDNNKDFLDRMQLISLQTYWDIEEYRFNNSENYQYLIMIGTNREIYVAGQNTRGQLGVGNFDEDILFQRINLDGINPKPKSYPEILEYTDEYIVIKFNEDRYSSGNHPRQNTNVFTLLSRVNIKSAKNSTNHVKNEDLL